MSYLIKECEYRLRHGKAIETIASELDMAQVEVEKVAARLNVHWSDLPPGVPLKMSGNRYTVAVNGVLICWNTSEAFQAQAFLDGIVSVS